jgi:hypothetical protein
MNLAFAPALAAMVTVLAYGFLAFTGHRMRSCKNYVGTVHLDELDGFTKAAFGTVMPPDVRGSATPGQRGGHHARSQSSVAGGG